MSAWLKRKHDLPGQKKRVYRAYYKIVEAAYKEAGVEWTHEMRTFLPDETG